ncbi:pyridoxine 5'-phosphate synthase [Gilvimarinus sp. F26214L]|uniref:pyridoxine 5'-phosphate synthase n=1 Tax=Gilvimarinus sp. DZF01 TaxID=3461371 RepID=UPI0040463DD6
MSIALSVNLNKIALIRNSRDGNYPDVRAFGRLCLDQGADGLTVHPRPDQRHIRPRDLDELSELVAEYPGREFNVEGNPFAGPLGSYPGFMELVRTTRPHQCTLVPDSTEQLTSDHGFDMRRDGERLMPIIDELRALGIRVSLFMDPELEQIRLAQQAGADRIELYTGPYADAFLNQDPGLEALYQRFHDAAAHATDLGLGVNAGHDLNLHNLPRFTTIPGLLEVSIGHALTVDALHQGMTNAVSAYLTICNGTR